MSALPSFFDEVVIHQDNDFIIVNKPAGLLSVPGKGADLADCLIARLKKVLPSVLLVHRLDRDTSGVMVFALNSQAQRHLSKQFELRQTQKQYQALVLGTLSGMGTVDVPVRYDDTRPPLHIADPAYHKQALTHWQVVDHLNINEQAVTRLLLKPITGRSHQLRVHMQHIGHAIVGDMLYAPAHSQLLSSRLCLHAAALTFLHPSTLQPVTFSQNTDF